MPPLSSSLPLAFTSFSSKMESDSVPISMPLPLLMPMWLPSTYSDFQPPMTSKAVPSVISVLAPTTPSMDAPPTTLVSLPMTSHSLSPWVLNSRLPPPPGLVEPRAMLDLWKGEYSPTNSCPLKSPRTIWLLAALLMALMALLLSVTWLGFCPLCTAEAMTGRSGSPSMKVSSTSVPLSSGKCRP